MDSISLKETQAYRLDTKTESILLLHARNTPQLQRQTLPQRKGVEKIFQSMDPKKNGIAILISNKIDFKLKLVKRNEKVHFIFILKTFIKMKS